MHKCHVYIHMCMDIKNKNRDKDTDMHVGTDLEKIEGRDRKSL